MNNLIALQDQETWLGNTFARDDIESSFARGDEPEWSHFTNPWNFYDPQQIKSRQQRWRREAGREEPEEDPYDLKYRRSSGPFVRQQAKIGRNAPCPCGSGKKYKKRCRNKVH